MFTFFPGRVTHAWIYQERLLKGTFFNHALFGFVAAMNYLSYGLPVIDVTF